MLGRVTTLVCVAICLGACHRLSPAEERLLGTWRWDSMDGTAYYVFKADHSFKCMSEDVPGRLVSTGTWKIEGDQVVIDSALNWSPTAGQTPPPREIERWQLADFGRDLLPYTPVPSKK